MSAESKTATAKWTEDSLLELLRERYPKDAYALLRHVRNGPGFRHQVRTLDGLVMSLWPSRGLEICGVEIKTSRADWLKELHDPEKADAFFKYCDRFWLLVSDPSIVLPGELPSVWGLMAPSRGKLKVIVNAPKLSAPVLLDRLFLASILSGVQKMSETEIHHIYQRGYDDGKLASNGNTVDDFKNLRTRLEALESSVDAFEKASGILINEYNGPSLGEAVRMVLSDEHLRQRDSLVNLKTQALAIARNIEQIIERS